MRLTLTAAVVCAAVSLSRLPDRVQGPATDRNTTWVAVNVMHKDGHLVTSLGARDFEIEFNGEKREVTAFRNDPIPFAVVIMVDVSGSMEANFGLVRRAVAALTSHFQPGDRAMVGSFSSLPHISPQFSARPDALQRSVTEALTGTLGVCEGDWLGNDFFQRLRNKGWSAIWDAAACGVNAAASDGETPRRVLVLMTDGKDNRSRTTAAEVIDRANTYGVMIYVVALAGSEGIDGPGLKSVADATGGGYFYLTGEGGVADAFTRIGEELRHQYVIGFASTASAGPSRIAVRSLAPETTARFRQVLMESVPAPLAAARTIAPPPLMAPSLPAGLAVADRTDGPGRPPPGTPPVSDAGRTAVWDDLDRFVAGGGTAATTRPAGFITFATLDMFRQSVARWVAAAGADAQPRRRVTAAAFALDLLHSQADPTLWYDGQPSSEILYWAGTALAAGPPTPAERLWYVGAIGFQQRGGGTKSLRNLVNRALERFPGEPRFVLARAVALELATWHAAEVGPGAPLTPASFDAIASQYEAARALPAVAFEAGLRRAFIDLRTGRLESAVARFDALGEPPAGDVILRFWWRLLKGRALEQADRLPEAIGLFEQALADVPGAASARSALIAALARARRLADASRVAAQGLAMPRQAIDPWLLYLIPEMRFWPAAEQALRAAVSR